MKRPRLCQDEAAAAAFLYLISIFARICCTIPPLIVGSAHVFVAAGPMLAVLQQDERDIDYGIWRTSSVAFIPFQFRRYSSPPLSKLDVSVSQLRYSLLIKLVECGGSLFFLSPL